MWLLTCSVLMVKTSDSKFKLKIQAAYNVQVLHHITMNDKK